VPRFDWTRDDLREERLRDRDQVLKFDPAGNAKILDELKASSKKDHLRVNMNGDLQGDTLKVTSVPLL
jgi:hypothetical protein